MWGVECNLCPALPIAAVLGHETALAAARVAPAYRHPANRPAAALPAWLSFPKS